MPPCLPPAYRFKPSDSELIKHYLLKVVLGEQLPSDAVIEGEVYGDDARLPTLIQSEADDIGDRELHMFDQNGTRRKRMTKNGYWKVTGNSKKIEDESGKHIGTMRSLVYKSERKRKRKRELLMDEYTLDGIFKNRNSEGWVLCKIKQSNRSPERTYSLEEEEEAEEEEGDGLTSRPTASPALQGIDNISSVEMDYIQASMVDNRPWQNVLFETAGGPSHMWSDQSWAMIEAYRHTLQMTPNLPPAYKFNPTHLELVIYYLLKKVLGEQLPSDAVIEGEVYGDDAQLQEADDIGDRELYMFVKIKKNQNGTETNRQTKNGYWKLTGNKEKIKDESGKHIGTMRSLVLVETNKSGRKRKLLMDEYTLDGSLKNIINSEGWVLCKIK